MAPYLPSSIYHLGLLPENIAQKTIIVALYDTAKQSNKEKGSS